MGDPFARSSENILTPWHWLGVVDARPLSIFRVLLGVTLLQDLAFRGTDLGTFLTEGGLFPLGTRAAGESLSLFHVATTPLPVALLFALGALSTVAFTVGFHTRVATFGTWLFFVSLHRRVGPIHTGGDALADLMLFFGCFVDLGGRFSLDAVRLGPRPVVRALVFRIMQYLPGLMYLYTARQKLLEGGRGWLGGPILFQHLQLDGWVRPPGLWLGAHPSLCAVLAAATIATEFLIPVFLVLPFRIRKARAAAILGNLGLQIGILLTLKVGIFTYVMFAISALWILPEWLDALGGRLAHVVGVRSVPPFGPPQRVLGAALFVIFLCVAGVPVVGRHLPSLVHRAVAFGELNLTAGMFTQASPSRRWEAMGRLSDGGIVDPLELVAPGVFVDGYVNSQWMQLPYHLDEYVGLGRFVCRHYNAVTMGPKLRSWMLGEVTRAPHLPGEPRSAETRRRLWSQDCEDPQAGARSGDAVHEGATDTNDDAGAVVESGSSAIPGAEGASGCGKAALASEQTVRVEVAGKGRTYLIRPPSPYYPSKPLAVVFYFHGLGGTIASSKGAQGMASAEGAAGSAIFVYPQGLYYPKFGGTGWDQSCSGVDVPFFDSMLDHLLSTYCVDPRAVFVSGFSWGGDMTDALACCRGERIRAVSVASGDELDANPTCPSTKLPAYRLTHTDSGDPFYTRAQFQASVSFYRSGHGCGPETDSVSPSPCLGYRGCDAPVIDCEYAGLGHQVPPDWGAASWSFFSSLR